MAAIDNLGEKVALGATGMMVGRLGMAASYGGPAKMYREAFDAGCNYFWWGALRRPAMSNALRELFAAGERERVVLALQTVMRWRGATTNSLTRQLRRLKTEYADEVVLTMLRTEPPAQLMDELHSLKERGLYRALGMTTHNRKLAGSLASRGMFDVFHIRYNFVHPGAEDDIFPYLSDHNPGIVVFSSSNRGRYRKLTYVDGTAVGMVDVYRWAVSDPHVHVVVSSPGSVEKLRQNLKLLSLPLMSNGDRAEMRALGKAVHEREG